MSKLFISHSSQDDEFVRNLREALSDHGPDGWIDSRELRGGDLLLTDIKKAIDESSSYAVVVSTDALQSTWVGKELRHALTLQADRGKDKFPIIPLSLNGTKLGVLEEFFGEEPLYIPVSSDAGGVEAAMNAILVALGKRDPADVPGTPQPEKPSAFPTSWGSMSVPAKISITANAGSKKSSRTLQPISESILHSSVCRITLLLLRSRRDVVATWDAAPKFLHRFSIRIRQLPSLPLGIPTDFNPIGPKVVRWP